MKEYQHRQEAIELHLQGKTIASIAQKKHRSRKWVHHWINRYKDDPNGEWYKDKSKAPKKRNRKLSEETEQQIISIRKDLEEEKMAQVGAISIQYEFERRGIKPIPAIWTINRTISKHGLKQPKPKREKTLVYPDLFIHTHQMDLVGPRYIKGDGRFYSINLIDVTNRACFVKSARTKSSANILEAIRLFWQEHGIPDALQMDNEMAFRGSNRYPHSFGKVIRFALSQDVSPVFIPVGEPWRNGIMEKFNDTYQKKFLKKYTFKDFNDLQVMEKRFTNFHNANHRYSSLSHKTPDQLKEPFPTLYHGRAHLTKKIPLEGGCVYYIRFIRSNLRLYLPMESFIMPPELKYCYVVAEVNIDTQSLVVRLDKEIKAVLRYEVPVDW